MAVTTTPNMGLNLPVPGQESGPEYATDNNAAFTVIDGHNHAPGSGVQITPAGMNINTDLAFENTNAYQLRSVRMNNNGAPLATPSDLNEIYVSGGNLYYNNASGTAVQITSGSSVNAGAGSITGLPSGSASVTFSGSTYVFQSATVTPATVDVGSVILRNTTASSKGLTLSPPSSLAADYGLVLPAIPAVQSFVTIDNSGNMAGGTPYPLTGAGIASNTIDNTKLTALGQQISADSGLFSTHSTTPVDVTNLSVTITTTGRPVWIGLISSNPMSGDSVVESISTVGDPSATIIILNGSSVISTYRSEIVASSASRVSLPSSVISTIDTPSAGTYTYKIQVNTSTASNSVQVQNTKLIAYEL